MYYQNQQTVLPTEDDVYDKLNDDPQYDNAMDNDPVATSCNHVLHHGCLNEWLKTNPSCPACRNMQSIRQCSILKSLSNATFIELSDARTSESHLSLNESFTFSENDGECENVELELDQVR